MPKVSPSRRIGTTTAEQTAELAEKLELQDIEMASGLDAISIAEFVGAYINTDDNVFIQPTAFILDPENRIALSVYSSAALGRLTPGDVAKMVQA